MFIVPEVIPLKISGAVGLMRPNITNSITQSGSSASSLVNFASPANANPFVQGTAANQPTTGTRTINGRNVLDLDGTSDYLSCNGLIPVFNGTDLPYTVFSVCEPDDYTSRVIWSAAKSALNSALVDYFFLNGTTTRNNKRDDANTLVGINGTVISGVNINCSISTGTTLSSFTNSTTDYSSQSQNVGLLSGIDSFNIGLVVTNVSAGYFDGKIGEIIVYNRALATAERQAVMRDLGNRYGVTV